MVREPSVDGMTHGAMYLNGHFHCWTLEDTIRERPGIPVEHWKINGQTAIAAGFYRVQLTPSARFARVMPELLSVPGFSGVRIHKGNTAADTEGCLLVGTGRTLANITGSAVAFERLMRVLSALPPIETIWITIENPRT